MSNLKPRTSTGQLTQMMEDLLDRLMEATAVEPLFVCQSSPANDAIADVVIQRLANLREVEQVPVVAISLK